MRAQTSPRAIALALTTLAAVGAGTSLLLLHQYLWPEAGACGPGGGCELVRSSSYARPLGIPMPALGLLFFGAFLAVLLVPRLRSRGRLALLGAIGGLTAVGLVGLQGLVMDVKTGNGAFMPTRAKSRALAVSIASVATGAGLPTTALVTDMDRPLADAAGNALEVAYAIDYLTGARREPRMHEVTMALAAEMLVSGRLARTTTTARKQLTAALESGAAAEKFERMVAALGGPKKLLSDPWKHLERAPVQMPVFPTRTGVVTKADTRAVGMVVVALGGGRTRPQDPVDPAVGLTELVGPGDRVGPDQPLGIVHARTDAQAAAAADLLRAAYKVGSRPPREANAVHERITA